jgi:hypothetical protein
MSYHITLQHEPDINTSPLFLVRIFGKENLDLTIETAACRLRGQRRLLVGKKLYYLFLNLILTLRQST